MLKNLFKKINANHQYKLGLKEHNQGRIDNAVKMYQRAIEKFYNHYPSHYALGGFFYETQQWDKALVHFKKIKELKPITFQIDMFIGICEMGMGNLEEAINLLNIQDEKTPNNSDVIGNRASIYLRLKDYDNAIKDVDRTIKLDPTNSFALSYKGEVLAIMEKYEESIELFDLAYNVDNNNHQAIFYKVLSLENLNRYDEAIENLNFLIEASPVASELYFKRGEIFNKLNNKESAQRDLKKASQMGNINAIQLMKNVF